MRVRAIALAVPLVLGMACASKQSTGAMSPPPAQGAEPQQAAGAAPSGEAFAQDPIMRPGPTIQGHAEDQVLVGQIAEATGTQITIQTSQGENRTLTIVPETMVQIDGMDASSDDLAEGQPVRASYDLVEGQDVAVKIRAGNPAAPVGETGQSGAAIPGAPADQGTGSSVQGGASPDAGWGPPPGGGSDTSSGASGSQR